MTANATTFAADLAKSSRVERNLLADDVNAMINKLLALRDAALEGRAWLASTINLAQAIATIEHRAVRIDMTDAMRTEVLDRA